MRAVSEKISEAELVVMEALWEASPQTANDVADRVTATRDWSLQTVKTLLSRLMAKDVIAADQDGRRFLYRPVIARDDYVASETGGTKADARKLVDLVFAAITEAAAKGDEISLNGFGKFKVKDSPAREGRNPANGETIQIAASKKLAFTPAKAVKDRLNG